MGQLAYQIPDDGRKKTILRIPESHTLYLCPAACGRRQGIRALKNGEADHASFLTLSQADVALGDYLSMVHDAVARLLDALTPAPRVLTLYVNCIDDFIGTDGPALLAELAAAHPGTRFLLSHINPVAADVSDPAAKDIQANLYAPLEPVPASLRDGGVNAVGGFVPVLREGEFRGFLEACGVPVLRELVSCATYDEYAALARSRLNLAVGRLGVGPCRTMEERLGIPWLSWQPCYDLDELDARYDRLARALDAPARPDTSAARARAEEAARAARAAVGDMPLVVDTSASLVPFSLALALLRAGFAVAAVFALHSKGDDAEAHGELARSHPEVLVVRDQGIEAMAGLGVPRACVSLGRDAAFLLRAEHLVGMYHDEGYCGFHGIERLMAGIVEAVSRTERWDG